LNVEVQYVGAGVNVLITTYVISAIFHPFCQKEIFLEKKIKGNFCQIANKFGKK
jgi:hypothetical protein